jgi:phospholipid/cholesterol/gamma-HCH transport system substrate-binding protein
MTQGQGRELVVGSVVIAAIAVVAVGTLWLKGTNFGVERTAVDVLVADVGQLTQGNSVKLRGVKIGQVEKVEVEPGGQVVRIELALEGDFAIQDPRDAGVIIAPESLFGDWQAEIVSRARFPQFAYYEPRSADQHGDTLVLGGYAIPDISRLTAAADEISQNLATLTDRFDRAFSEETADQLRGAIGNIEAVSNDIREMIGQQATTFTAVSTDVARAANEISQASTQARVTLQELDAILNRGDVDSILVNVRRASSSIDEIVARVNSSTEGLPKTIAKADSAFGSVQRLTMRIESGQGSLGRLLVDSTLAVRAEGAMAQLDSLLADMKANPRRYIRLSIF